MIPHGNVVSPPYPCCSYKRPLIISNDSIDYPAGVLISIIVIGGSATMFGGTKLSNPDNALSKLVQVIKKEYKGQDFAGKLDAVRVQQIHKFVHRPHTLRRKLLRELLELNKIEVSPQHTLGPRCVDNLERLMGREVTKLRFRKACLEIERESNKGSN